MTNEQRVTITEEGRKALDDIYRRFAAGESIEDIAESYNITTAAVQVIVAVDILTEERNGTE